ncbi:MAG: glycosyltransferase [Acidimicrobiales bacterium]|nr:glycosyltransferase [Acidimicrobiales bacterium]
MSGKLPVDQSERPRILVISDEMAWPLVSGMRRRLGHTLSALTQVGDVHWVACPRSGVAAAPCVPSDLPISTTVVPAPDNNANRRMLNWLSGRRPWTLCGGDWGAAGAALADLHDNDFDLEWTAGFDSWLAARKAGVRSKKSILDLADIESAKLRSRLRAGVDKGPKGWLRRVMGFEDLRRWRALEQQAAQNIDAISVCSAEESLAMPGPTFVTTNSYADPGPTGEPRSATRLLFVGSLNYPPNLGGLEFFVREVFGALHQSDGSLTFRIVGRGLDPDHWLRHEPGVQVAEDVDDIGPEVAKATVAVVPLLWGGGTRLKIIEAFAFSTPVVSTTAGAEGLLAVHGESIVIADTATELLAACRRLLSDPAERLRLGSAGRMHYLQHFEAREVERALVARVEALLYDKP